MKRAMVDVQEEEADLEEEEEEVILEEEEEERKTQKMNEHHHKGGDTLKEELVKVKIKGICNDITVISLAILRMNAKRSKHMKAKQQIMEKKSMDIVKNNCSCQ